jgi:cation diffusion facilitator CzcD-associated flavoprotein CzcO
MPKKTNASPDCDVTIIGAGPYGLSAAAHLQAKGLGVRVFGEPMQFWANKMPAGMLLRSPRAASSLSDPQAARTLEAYEVASGTRPATRVALETFVAYGKWFEKLLGPVLDQRAVSRVHRTASGFQLSLADGNVVTSRRVVVAAGIGPFQKRPQPFAALSSRCFSHCYEGRPLSEFSGKRVAVIGAGQSSLESAALLSEAGAAVELIVRNPFLRWIGRHGWLHHMGPVSAMLYSKHDVGPAGISRLVASPGLMSRMPLVLRDRIRTRAVRPAGSPWLGERLTPVTVTTGRTVALAKDCREGVQLRLDDGTERCVEHVLLGTGYKVDISRYSFLSPELLQDVEMFDGFPKLDKGLCSSVPGLHFAGAPAARTFGPLLYFVAGTRFASCSLATALGRRNRL